MRLTSRPNPGWLRSMWVAGTILESDVAHFLLSLFKTYLKTDGSKILSSNTKNLHKRVQEKALTYYYRDSLSCLTFSSLEQVHRNKKEVKTIYYSKCFFIPTLPLLSLPDKCFRSLQSFQIN